MFISRSHPYTRIYNKLARHNSVANNKKQVLNNKNYQHCNTIKHGIGNALRRSQTNCQKSDHCDQCQKAKSTQINCKWLHKIKKAKPKTNSNHKGKYKLCLILLCLATTKDVRTTTQTPKTILWKFMHGMFFLELFLFTGMCVCAMSLRCMDCVLWPFLVCSVSVSRSLLMASMTSVDQEPLVEAGSLDLPGALGRSSTCNASAALHWSGYFVSAVATVLQHTIAGLDWERLGGPTACRVLPCLA